LAKERSSIPLAKKVHAAQQSKGCYRERKEREGERRERRERGGRERESGEGEREEVVEV
jgi:hypothetical protein